MFVAGKLVEYNVQCEYSMHLDTDTAAWHEG